MKQQEQKMNGNGALHYGMLTCLEQQNDYEDVLPQQNEVYVCVARKIIYQIVVGSIFVSLL